MDRSLEASCVKDALDATHAAISLSMHNRLLYTLLWRHSTCARDIQGFLTLTISQQTAQQQAPGWCALLCILSCCSIPHMTCTDKYRCRTPGGGVFQHRRFILFLAILGNIMVSRAAILV